MEHKEAVGKALFRRAESHSSDLTIQCSKEQRILKEVKSNGYPMRRMTVMKQKAQERRKKKSTGTVGLPFLMLKDYQR